MTTKPPRIDFELISKAALNSARRLLGDWLPGGDWNGDEYKPLNPTRDDRTRGSFVINSSTGKWIDNATGDSGGDLISLYAYIRFMSQKDAAIAVAGMVGIEVEVGKRFIAKANKPQVNSVDKRKLSIEEEHARSPWAPIYLCLMMLRSHRLRITCAVSQQ